MDGRGLSEKKGFSDGGKKKGDRYSFHLEERGELYCTILGLIIGGKKEEGEKGPEGGRKPCPASGGGNCNYLEKKVGRKILEHRSRKGVRRKGIGSGNTDLP